MATFTTRFLGCKVSHADAEAIREALLADGHEAAGAAADVAVVNTCCVTHEAVRKSRQAAARAARTHRRVYVTGCAANLPGALRGLPENVRVVARSSEETPAAVAGDVGALACIRPEQRRERTRAFVKIQDGCSFSCRFCVIPLVRGQLAQPLVGGRAGRGAHPRGAGPARDRAQRRQPRALPRPCRAAPAAGPPAPRGRGARRRADPAFLDRGQPPRPAARRRLDAVHLRSVATSTSRSSRATTTCCAPWGAATTVRSTCARSRRSARPASTSRPT